MKNPSVISHGPALLLYQNGKMTTDEDALEYYFPLLHRVINFTSTHSPGLPKQFIIRYHVYIMHQKRLNLPPSIYV